MIEIFLTQSGNVGLVPTTKKDRRILTNIPYLKTRRDGLSVCYWTYIKDVFRDIPITDRKVRGSFKGILRGLVGCLETAQETYQLDQISSWFKGEESPYKFQGKSISFGLETECILVADATGLGKSISSLGIALGAFELGRADRALFIVPAGLKFQWFSEIEKFAREDLIPRGVKIVNGAKAKRKRIYTSDWDILITSPGLVINDSEYFERKIHGIDVVVLDEASCIRNEDNTISRVMKRVFSKNRYKIALTATPIENRLLDLFSIFEWIDPRIFVNNQVFNDRYIEWTTKTISVRKKTRTGFSSFRIKKPVVKRYKNLEDVAAKTRPAYIRRRVSDVGMELPSLVCNWEVIRLSKKEREVYKECLDSAEDNTTLKDEALNSWLQGVRQACNSVELVSKEAKARSSKIGRLKHLLDTELVGEQVIVFTDYERFAKMIAAELPMKVALFTGANKNSRDGEMAAFKIGDRKVLIATSAGERGHNLQNASVIINIDLPFNPARLKQRIGRIVRINSPNDTVRMINFIAQDTIEETIIRNAIYAKRKLDEQVIGKDTLAEADPIKNLITDVSILQSGQ